LDDDFFGRSSKKEAKAEEELPWRPFQQGGFLDVDTEELVGFNDDGDWELLDEDDSELVYEDDEVWSASDPVKK
jgi:hypothetical protein